MDASFWFIAMGTLVFGAYLVSARILEKRWAPPSLLFFLAFFSHAFLYLYVILLDENIYDVFAYRNFDNILGYSLASFLALHFGYVCYALTSASPKKYKPIWTNPMSAESALRFGMVAIVLVGISLVHTVHSDALFEAKGVGAYSAESPSPLARLGFIAFHTAGPILFLAFIASTQHRGKAQRKIFVTLLIALTLVLTQSLLLLERKSTVSLLLYLIAFYHYRVRTIRIWQLAAMVTALMLLQAFTHLRAFGTGILEISATELLGALADAIIERPTQLLVQIATAIPGQDVFSNVLDIVPNREPYKLGATYIQSLWSLLTPRVLGLGSYAEVTPSVWYMNAYAPGTEGHGYDFTMLAEAYINFGPWMPAIFFPVGILVGKLSHAIVNSTSPFVVFACIVILVALALSLRSDSNTLLKSCVYMVLPPIILARVLSSVRGRQNPSNESATVRPQ